MRFEEEEWFNDRISELQADNTRLVEERRAVDIRYNVEHFHRLFNIPVRETPVVPPENEVRLRLRLISEEFFELMRACGIQCTGAENVLTAQINIDELKVDIVEVADALADMDYINAGTYLVFGIDGRPIASEVHRSNVAKAGAVVREDGKILKPKDWAPPDILGVLRNQGYRGE
jgi:predicted HAD superfamily Cof-like phosphohydrolase